MNIDFNSLLTTLMSLLAGGGGGWLLRASRRKANAEAAKMEVEASEAALLQIRQLQEAYAALNAQVIDLQTQVANLQRENQELRNELSFCRMGMSVAPGEGSAA
ncbi:MAG: hypothetical protein HDS26_04380 [Bacteroides sp.]|nr:hypothetical protein [Bacteroides sp.]MBD5306361.1 hypothetical protein [Bacteroides sp.]